MDIINQVDYINQKVKESYCSHNYLTPLDATTSKVGDISFPVTCDDCGKVMECEHEEVDFTEFALPTCILCGAMGEDVVNMGGYDD